MSTTEGATPQAPFTPSTDNIDETLGLFKPGHVTQISLRILQDVTQAKTLLQTVNMRTRPVLSDLEITFRAIYDKPDGTTTVRIARKAFRPEPSAGHERALAVCLGLRGIDLKHMRIPARVRNAFDEVATRSGVWIARLVAFISKDLQEEGYARLEYYKVFKEIALRKEGKEWDVDDVESVIDFFADRRGR